MSIFKTTTYFEYQHDEILELLEINKRAWNLLEKVKLEPFHVRSAVELVISGSEEILDTIQESSMSLFDAYLEDHNMLN